MGKFFNGLVWLSFFVIELIFIYKASNAGFYHHDYVKAIFYGVVAIYASISCSQMSNTENFDKIKEKLGLNKKEEV